MQEIIKNLYVGDKNDSNICKETTMNFLCCDNTQTTWPKIGRGDGYHWKYVDNGLYLNMVDADKANYFNDKMIIEGVRYISQVLSEDKKILVYCSKGKSRSPSMAFIYMLATNLIRKDSDAFKKFKKIYPWYSPNIGILQFINERIIR